MARARRRLQQTWLVRLVDPAPKARGWAWTARVTRTGFGQVPEPTRDQLEAAARWQAVAAFGPQAQGWRLLDAHKATKRPRPV
jgi:hypothetical protein